MSETVQLRLTEPTMTHDAGLSLASTLYGTSVDIFLNGTLGAGKTTFLQGVAEGLGIREQIVSPTYALEQRYQTATMGECIHIDLYRLDNNQAEELIAQTDEHTGIRCIEWAERLQKRSGSSIHITLEETQDPQTRNMEIVFEDIELPSDKQISEWRAEVCLPQNVVNHCNVVADVCTNIAEYCIQKGIIVRKRAVHNAGKLHDLLRFIDFHSGSDHLNPDVSERQKVVWGQYKKMFVNMGHEEAAAQFLEQKNYKELASIVQPHGLRKKKEERKTIEQKILFYADKRVALDKIVTLDERFEDFQRRYSDGKQTQQQKDWYEECKLVEKDLFPDSLLPL